MKTAFIKPAPEGEASLPSLYTCIPKPVIPVWMPESRRRDVKVRIHPAAKIDAPKPAAMRGVTLIELTVVLLVLVALAGLTLPMVTNTPRYAQCVATDATMANIRDAIVGGGGQGGYRSDMGRWPSFDNGAVTASSLNNLFNNPLYDGDNNTSFNIQTNTITSPTLQTPSFNSVTQRGWRGPYLSGGMTCLTIENKVTGLTLNNPIDSQNVCNLSATPVAAHTVALDSFPVITTNTDGSTAIVLQGSPIVLMQDTNANHFLVSGGPTGGIEINAGSMGSRTTIDDRVLYLDAVDSGSNQPCS